MISLISKGGITMDNLEYYFPIIKDSLKHYFPSIMQYLGYLVNIISFFVFTIKVSSKIKEKISLTINKFSSAVKKIEAWFCKNKDTIIYVIKKIAAFAYELFMIIVEKLLCSRITIIVYCLLFVVTFISNSIVCEAEEKYIRIEKIINNFDQGTINCDNENAIINRRKGRMELCPNGAAAWFLANYYQRYALNCLKQTDEANIILYYYMKSIHYAEKCLEFDVDTEDKEMRIKYIQMRYKDIVDCNILDNKIRLRAYEAYCVIDNALATINLEDLSFSGI